MNKYFVIYFFLIIGHRDIYSFDFGFLFVPIVYTSYSFLNYFWGDNKYKKEYINIPMSLEKKYISSVYCYFGKNFFDRAKIINFYQNYACLKKTTVVPFFASMIVPYTINKISGKDGVSVSDVFMGLFIQFATTLLVESILCNMNNFSVEKSVDEFRSNTSIKSKLFVSSFFKKYVTTYIRALHSDEILEKNKDLYEMKGVYFNFIDMEKMIDKNSTEINNYTSIFYSYMNTIYDKYLNRTIVDNNLSDIVCAMRSLSSKISKIFMLCKNISTLLEDNEKYIIYEEKFLFSICPINVFLSNDNFLLGLNVANDYVDSVIFALTKKESELFSFITQSEFKDYKKVVDLYNSYKKNLFKKNVIIDNCFKKKNILISWFNSLDIVQEKKRIIEEDIRTIESVKLLLDNILMIEQDIKKNEKMYYNLTSSWYFKSISYDPISFVNLYSYSFDDMKSYINLLQCKSNKIINLINSINLTKEKFNFVYTKGEKLKTMFHEVSQLSSFTKFANKENFEQSVSNFNYKNEKYQADSDFIILTKRGYLEQEYKNKDEIFFRRWIDVLSDFKIVENVYLSKKNALYDFKNHIMEYKNNIFFEIIFKNFTVSESYKNYIEYFLFLNKEIFGDMDTNIYKEKKEELLQEEKKQTCHIENNNKEFKKIAQLVLFEDSCLLNNPLHFLPAQLNYIITNYKNLLYENNFFMQNNLELILKNDVSLNEYFLKIDISNFQEHIQVLSQYHRIFIF